MIYQHIAYTTHASTPGGLYSDMFIFSGISHVSYDLDEWGQQINPVPGYATLIVDVHPGGTGSSLGYAGNVITWSEIIYTNYNPPTIKWSFSYNLLKYNGSYSSSYWYPLQDFVSFSYSY